MFSKKILSTVAILFAYGLNSVKATNGVFPSCGGITFASANEKTGDTDISAFIDEYGSDLKNCIDDNGTVYAYEDINNKYVKGYVKGIDTSITPDPEADLPYDSFTKLVEGFNILDIEGDNVSKIEVFTHYEGYVSQGDTLAILKCDQEEDGSLKCKQTYGYIKSGKGDGKYYYIGEDKISLETEEAVTSDEVNGNCAGNIGTVINITDEGMGVCFDGRYDDDYGDLGLVQFESDEKNYLLIGKSGIATGSAFKGLNDGTDENGIIIVSQKEIVVKEDIDGDGDDEVVYQQPSMLVFDPTHTVTNDCFISADNSITSRIDNLCNSGDDCDFYYYCDDGICTLATSVEPRVETKYECNPLINDDENVYTQCRGIKPVNDDYYSCDGVRPCVKIEEWGYYLNKETSPAHKYYECSTGANDKINCVPATIETTCEAGKAGKLFNAGSGDVSLCLESGIPLPLTTVSETPEYYFVSDGSKEGNYYYSVTFESGNVTKTKAELLAASNNISAWYKYADANNKILAKDDATRGGDSSKCKTQGSIIEYQIETDNTIEEGNPKTITHDNVYNGYYRKSGVTN